MERLSLENTVSAKLMLSESKIYHRDETIVATKLPFELFLCAGKGSFLIDAGGEQISVSEREAVLVPCDTEYTLDVSEGSELVFAAIGLSVYSNLQVFSLFDMKTYFDGRTGEKITEICRELSELSSEREFTNLRLENAVKIKCGIYRLARIALDSALPKSGGRDIMDRHEKLAAVLEYIHVNIKRNIMQSELSDILEMTPDSFYRMFRRLIGVPPKDFIISEKLRIAREMLALGELPIGEISKMLGYDNQLYFSALFRKKYGVCPTEYRKAAERII